MAPHTSPPQHTVAGSHRAPPYEPRPGKLGGRSKMTLRHPQEPGVCGTPPRHPLAQGDKQISLANRGRGIMTQQSDHDLPGRLPQGPGGRGKPAREEGPGGRPGRSRHKPTTGPGQITIEVAIDNPAGQAAERLGEHKQEDTRKTTTQEVGSDGGMGKIRRTRSTVRKVGHGDARWTRVAIYLVHRASGWRGRNKGGRRKETGRPEETVRPNICYE